MQYRDLNTDMVLTLHVLVAETKFVRYRIPVVHGAGTLRSEVTNQLILTN